MVRGVAPKEVLERARGQGIPELLRSVLRLREYVFTALAKLSQPVAFSPCRWAWLIVAEAAKAGQSFLHLLTRTVTRSRQRTPVGSLLLVRSVVLTDRCANQPLLGGSAFAL
jgi:hypothetical protein